MTIPQTVSQILDEHVTLELECIDRLYLGLYVPVLQEPRGVAWFWKTHRGHNFASSSLMAPMTERFVRRIAEFAKREGIDVVQFPKGQRKADLAQHHLAQFDRDEGVLFIGKAQERATVVRTERRRNPKTGRSYAWLVRTSTVVNHYYCYCVDRDFGPFFIKFCSYFPYNAKACLNGHEYLKRQLAKRAVAVGGFFLFRRADRSPPPAALRSAGPPSYLRAAYAARCARGPDPACLPARHQLDSILTLLPPQGV
jgi:hypothetical protein